VTDAGGNTGTASKRVVVDRTLKGLGWSADFYPQDRDALAATSTLSFTLARDAKTTLRVYDAAGRLVRTVWTGKDLGDGTRTWKWTGVDGSGRQVPQGTYTARLRVMSPWATLEYSATVRASAFAVIPDHTTVRAGQTLKVRFRSTERLSTTPRVTFTQPGRAGVTVTATKLSDGSWRASFVVRSGSAGTGSVKVTAKDSGGRVNLTKVPIRVRS
jgi:hypothetical protein